MDKAAGKKQRLLWGWSVCFGCVKPDYLLVRLFQKPAHLLGLLKLPCIPPMLPGIFPVPLLCLQPGQTHKGFVSPIGRLPLPVQIGGIQPSGLRTASAAYEDGNNRHINLFILPVFHEQGTGHPGSLLCLPCQGQISGLFHAIPWMGYAQ